MPSPSHSLPFLGTLALAASCGFLTEKDLDQRMDQDGDGYAAEQYGGTDCDDANRDIWPGAVEICDGIDNDCDGDSDGDALDKRTWYRDADADGYGSPSSEEPSVSCFPPDGFVGDASDCNDDPDNNGANIHPQTIWFKDKDGDGYGDPEDAVVTCIQLPGLVADDQDCDDADPDLHPETVWWEDKDGDGHGTSDAETTACWLEDEVPEGFVRASTLPTDCDDEDPDVYPGAKELWFDPTLNDCTGTLNTVSVGTAEATRSGRGAGDHLGKAVRGIGYFFDCDPNRVAGPEEEPCEDVGQLPDVALAGPNEDSNGPSSGAVYILDTEFGDEPLRTTLLGGASINRLGRHLTAPGDLNDDGYDDLLIGTQDDYAYVYFGGLPRDTEATLSSHHKSAHIAVYVSESDGDEIGASGAGLRGFCEDGDPDLALGAPLSSSLGDGSGRVYIFPNASLTSTINLHDARLSVDTAPTDEGTGDELIEDTGRIPGSDDTSAGEDDSSTGTTLAEIWTVEPEPDGAGALFGQTMANIGDFDGDGIHDLLIGAPSGDWGETDAGRVYLLSFSDFASGSGLSDDSPVPPAGSAETGFTKEIFADALMRVNGKSEGDHLGRVIAAAGDFNGDGYMDVAIAATGLTSSPQPGLVYIWLGKAKDGEGTSGETPLKIDDIADIIIQGDLTLGAGNFGGSLSTAGPILGVLETKVAGDLDGDGRGDLLIGSPDVDDPAYAAGQVFLVYGGILGNWSVEDLMLPPESTGGTDERSGYTRVGALFTGEAAYNLGTAVDGPGDLNGDGHPDLLLGAPGADLLGVGTGAGAAFFMSGVEG